MDAKAREALQGSIEHWKRLNAANTKDEVAKEGIGAENCSLCLAFNNDNIPYDAKCNGCPIFERTGEKVCEGTPYGSAWNAQAGDFDHDKWKEKSGQMLEFLQSIEGDLDRQLTADMKMALEAIILCSVDTWAVNVAKKTLGV